LHSSAMRLAEGAVIGLPRALLFFELYPFWRAFFNGLGLVCAVSAPTSPETIEIGAREADDGTCLPVKTFYGHAASLRDRVDAIFLPRLVSLTRGTYTCPKMLGIPDMIRHNLERMPRILVTCVDATRGTGLVESSVALGRSLGRSAAHARTAARAGLEALRVFRDGLEQNLSFSQAIVEQFPREISRLCRETGNDASVGPGRRLRARVGLVGHAYNLFDPGVNLDLVRKLAKLGCDLRTSEHLSLVEVEAESSLLPKAIFWSGGRRVLAAVSLFRRQRLVDGIIHVVSFGCGPDSMVGEIAEREIRRSSSLPYLALTIDEHAAEAGLVTRLEAFTDMLERRRAGVGSA
jgi:predicted nucleotide-binding protein (sugar kinase/HSP70/actin superfamily)